MKRTCWSCFLSHKSCVWPEGKDHCNRCGMIEQCRPRPQKQTQMVAPPTDQTAVASVASAFEQFSFSTKLSQINPILVAENLWVLPGITESGNVSVK
jgi:hypothetical protein